MSVQAPAMQLQALLLPLLHKLYPANRYAAYHQTAHNWFLENMHVCVHACVHACMCACMTATVSCTRPTGAHSAALLCLPEWSCPPLLPCSSYRQTDSIAALFGKHKCRPGRPGSTKGCNNTRPQCSRCKSSSSMLAAQEPPLHFPCHTAFICLDQSTPCQAVFPEGKKSPAYNW